MSYGHESALDETTEATVAAYLREHPDFFERHPELLAELRLAHDSGRAVSLIERQVAVLRQTRTEQDRRLQQMLHEAQRNERLSDQFNRLVLELLDARTLDAVVESVKRRVIEDFDADAVGLRLFRTGCHANNERPEFLERSASNIAPFEKIITGRQPICGQFTPEQLAVLFADAAQVRSAALIPLTEDGDSTPAYGMLAIGSHDAQRFNSRMGTLFLQQIGRVLTRVLRPHFAT